MLLVMPDFYPLHLYWLSSVPKEKQTTNASVNVVVFIPPLVLTCTSHV